MHLNVWHVSYVWYYSGLNTNALKHAETEECHVLTYLDGIGSVETQLEHVLGSSKRLYKINWAKWLGNVINYGSEVLHEQDIRYPKVGICTTQPATPSSSESTHQP